MTAYATPETLFAPVPGSCQVLPPLPAAEEWHERLAWRLFQQGNNIESIDWCISARGAAAELRAVRFGRPLPFGMAAVPAPALAFPATDAFPRR